MKSRYKGHKFDYKVIADANRLSPFLWGIVVQVEIQWLLQCFE